MASQDQWKQGPWKRYCDFLCRVESLGLSVDISRMAFPKGFFAGRRAAMARAFRAMDRLERGAKANRSEKRRVGHFWLRAPHLAPKAEIRRAIEEAQARVREFAAGVHDGSIRPPDKARFTNLLVIGIGGSALGPQFVADALGQGAADRLHPHFVDNTDPDGIARTLAGIGDRLDETLCIVISKSGGTAETRNGMLHAKHVYGQRFRHHAVAITKEDSALDKLARDEHWLARFPMWDWVGGRFSETSAVGLLPAALQGIDVDAILAGAAACDEATRNHRLEENAAALLALMWYHATGGRGRKQMVVLPYKDRLLLFSRYLQQLVMESLGKERDLRGRVVRQGLSVYGNKGSTDQHAYVQQLRDGIDNFFVVFIRVLQSGGTSLFVEEGATSGDYLHGFLLGTRQALAENRRQSITITIPRVDARSIGALIGLFERAVGLYASLINVNAYDQPGVEAGKKAADAVLALQKEVVGALSDEPRTADGIAADLGADPETVFHLLEHLAANGRARLVRPGPPDVAAFTRT